MPKKLVPDPAAIEAFEALRDRILHAIIRCKPHDLKFVLNQPDKLTTKSRGGAFSKKPYIGDEELVLFNAYLGKTNRVILQFQEASESHTVEIPFNDCVGKLNGFKEFYNMANDLRDDSNMKDAREEAEAKERHAYAEAAKARHVENPNWGTW